MTSLVQQLGRLAIRTFRRDPPISPGTFNSQYDQLYNLLSKITPEDINLHQNLLLDRGQYNPSTDGAPVTYMQLFEDSDLTICVFILKRGVRLPLHDHPGMYGLLKVLHGTVSVQSYSHLSADIVESNLQGIDLQSQNGVYPTSKHPKVTVTANDPACRLAPNNANIHEIHSVDGPAAFLDILSPPYGTDALLGVERDCHYYEEIQTFEVTQLPEKNLTLLMSVPSPPDFWCDQADYNGPVVSRNLEENDP